MANYRLTHNLNGNSYTSNFTIPTNKAGKYKITIEEDRETSGPGTSASSPSGDYITVDDKDHKYRLSFYYSSNSGGSGPVVSSNDFIVPAGQLAQPIISGSYQLAPNKNASDCLYYYLNNISITNSNSITVDCEVIFYNNDRYDTNGDYLSSRKNVHYAHFSLPGNSTKNIHASNSSYSDYDYSIYNIKKNGNLAVSVTFTNGNYTPSTNNQSFYINFFDSLSERDETVTTTTSYGSYAWRLG